MKILLSSAKTMGHSSIAGSQMPSFMEEAIKMQGNMSKWSLLKIASFHGTSPALSAKIKERLAEWNADSHLMSGSAALGSFQGEAFAKFNLETLSTEAQARALASIYIGSGLYGVLRGSDSIQPYRLDMDQKWGGQSLRNFWTVKISAWLREELQNQPLINLASAEYSEAFDRSGMEWIDIDFLQESGGKRKAVSVFSKQARGLMARHLCEHYDQGVHAIPLFTAEGYQLDTATSHPNRFVFVR